MMRMADLLTSRLCINLRSGDHGNPSPKKVKKIVR